MNPATIITGVSTLLKLGSGTPETDPYFQKNLQAELGSYTQPEPEIMNKNIIYGMAGLSALVIFLIIIFK